MASWDRSGPEWDLPGAGPRRVGYVIASLPRTGSTLLARSLWATGVAGAPDEYLNPLQRRRLRRWEGGSTAEYVRALTRHRTSRNGVFGLKIHYPHLERYVLAGGTDLADLLGPLRWVATTRVDLVAQAVSLDLARRTGRWWGGEPPPPLRIGYDRASIERRLAEIRRGEIGWQRYFRRRGIRPLRLTFEEIVEHREEAVRRVLRHLGVEAEVEGTDPGTIPTDAPQAGEWIERFRTGTARHYGVRS